MKHFNFRFPLIDSFLLVCFTGLAVKPASGDGKGKKPNIIMFLVDDMGWQDTSVPFWKMKTPFNERYKTPAMERLAREGMMFTQAYASSVSSPTRVSLITGMNAARHRVTNWTLERDKSVDGKSEILGFLTGMSTGYNQLILFHIRRLQLCCPEF